MGLIRAWWLAGEIGSCGEWLGVLDVLLYGCVCGSSGLRYYSVFPPFFPRRSIPPVGCDRWGGEICEGSFPYLGRLAGVPLSVWGQLLILFSHVDYAPVVGYVGCYLVR